MQAASGVDHHTSGSSGSTHIQATATVRTPVRVRSMMDGAASAPRMPPMPAAVDTRPICAAG